MDLKPEILIVDDTPECLRACEKTLADVDAVIVKASSGNEALRATLYHDFALAVIDVKMPEMDGYELAQLLRADEKTRDLPIIFLSAVYTDEFHIFKGYESGAVDFIAKPCNPKLLTSKVKVFLSLDRQKKRMQALIRDLEKTNEQLSNEIVQRKSIEATLRESETRYRAIVQDQTELICRFKPGGPVIFVNDACCRYFDRRFEELVGRSFMPFIPEEDHGLLMKSLSSLSLENPVIAIEHRVIAGNGEIRWQQWTNRALFDENGRVFEVQAVGRDVTERRQAEAALQLSEERFRLFMDNSPVIAWTKDEQGRHVYLNKTYEEHFGVSLEDWRGKTDFEVWPLETAQEFRKNDLAVLAAGKSMEIIEETTNPDGSRSYWLNSKFPFRDASGERYVAGIGLDITERKRSEEALLAKEAELQLIADATPVVLTRLSRDLKYVFVNRACTEMFRRTREEIVGKSIVEIMGRDALETIRPYVERVLQGERVEYETQIPYQGIGTRFMHVTYVPEKNRHGEIVGWLASVLDITERKRAEEALRQLTAELEAANKEIEAFSYSVSHDLRAPLRSITGFSRAILEDCSGQLDETGRDHVNRVLAAGQRMGELIDAMLTLSRLTRGELNPRQVNLSQMVREIADELENNEPEREVEFVITDNLMAHGDHAMLQAVIDNLLRNAWKFTAKKPKARIEFGTQDLEGEKVYFVRDNGAGFNMAYADRLFVAFKRLHRESDFPGIGIGLTTVQRIIHRHGGRIWAEGAVGKGATFYFTLG